MKIPQRVAVRRARVSRVFSNRNLRQQGWFEAATLAIALVLFFATAQRTASQELAAASPQRDPQALGIIVSALNAMGGASVLAGIQDIRGSGTVTYNWAGSQVQAAVIVKGRGLSQFRLDATLPDGIYSWGVSNGQRFRKNADGTISAPPYGTRPCFENTPLPFVQLLAAMQDSSNSVSYIGLESRNGNTVNHIRITSAGSASSTTSTATLANKTGTIDIFIDNTTNLIQSVLTIAYSADFPGQTYPREIQYSNHQVLNGVVVPLSIVELIDGEQTLAMQLSQVSFNIGLSDNDFQP